jgi:hypothetical protein
MRCVEVHAEGEDAAAVARVREACSHPCPCAIARWLRGPSWHACIRLHLYSSWPAQPGPAPRRAASPPPGEAEHAAIGHAAVLNLVPTSHTHILRAAMADHDRDFAAFYNAVADLLQVRGCLHCAVLRCRGGL